MRDIVWTLIIVWLIYKFVDMFKSASPKKVAFGEDNNFFDSHTKTHTNSHTHTTKDIKKAVKKSADKEGEYIDYEELK